MENFDVIIWVAGELFELEGVSEAFGRGVVMAFEAALPGWGFSQDEWGFWRRGEDCADLLVCPGFDESVSPWGEAEQGWRNIRADEAAAVARQVEEDRELSGWVAPSYMGVRGSRDGDGGWIYEP